MTDTSITFHENAVLPTLDSRLASKNSDHAFSNSTGIFLKAMTIAISSPTAHITAVLFLPDALDEKALATSVIAGGIKDCPFISFTDKPDTLHIYKDFNRSMHASPTMYADFISQIKDKYVIVFPSTIDDMNVVTKHFSAEVINILKDPPSNARVFNNKDPQIMLQSGEPIRKVTGLPSTMVHPLDMA